MKCFLHKISKAITNPRKILIYLLNQEFVAGLFSDKLYLKIKYRLIMKKRLNIESPQTYNEKLQWLKLYDRRPEYTKMVDKYEVRKYIAEKLGEEYLIPLLGVWDNPDDIDFDALPDQFVLKCNHNSGLGMYICKDKSKLDIEKVKKDLRKGLKQDYFITSREWPYKNVKPRIVAEEFMVTESGEEIMDYKVHNFNGKPEFILVCDGRFSKEGLTEDFYDTTWNHLNIKRPDIPNKKEVHQKPETLEKMLELSEILAKDIPFLRTDFYEIDGKIYFGEITFFPASGMKKFVPENWDNTLGDKMALNFQDR